MTRGETDHCDLAFPMSSSFTALGQVKTGFPNRAVLGFCEEIPSESIYHYGYDKAGNRTEEQTGSSTHNGLNQLIGQGAGGMTHFRGD